MRRPPTPLLLLGLAKAAFGAYLVAAPLLQLPYEPRLPQDADPGEAALHALAILTGVVTLAIGIGLLAGEAIAWWIALALAVEDLLTGSLLTLTLIRVTVPLALVALYVLARADTRAHVGVFLRHDKAPPTPAESSAPA